MKLLDYLIFSSMFSWMFCLSGISPVIATSTAEKPHPKTNQVKLKRRQIIDYVDSSKPILFGGSYNLVSEWTGKKDPLNSDQSYVYRHSTDLSNRKRKREGSPKSDGKTKIGKTQKNKTSLNKQKENKKNQKKGKTFDNNLNGKAKSVVSKEADFKSPWNYNAWNGGMFRKAARCVDIPSNMSLCRGVGYDRMRVPNLLDHDSELEAVVQSSYWIPLWSSKCHRDTRIFLCSMFAPVCMEQPIYPCRSLCEEVKNSCVERMNKHGFPWPEFLECDQFPDDTQLCIGVRNEKELDSGDKCSVCSPVESMENVIDNFCNAEFVAKITVERTEAVNGDLRIISNIKKKIYKKPEENRRQLTMAREWMIRDYAKCECPFAASLRGHKNRRPRSVESAEQQRTQHAETRKKPLRDNQFLVMGSRKKGQKFVLSFVQPMKRGPSILNKAMKMLTADNKKMCSTMSG